MHVINLRRQIGSIRERAKKKKEKISHLDTTREKDNSRLSLWVISIRDETEERCTIEIALIIDNGSSSSWRDIDSEKTHCNIIAVFLPGSENGNLIY